MKSVMLHINDDAGQDARLAAAVALARDQSAELNCIQVTPMSGYVATDPLGGMYAVTMLVDQLAKQAAEIRARIEARLAHDRVACNWSAHTGNVEGTIVSRSHLSDLIVLSLTDGESGAGHPLPMVADVAVHSQTPVFAVPGAAIAFDPNGVALIAWNGSPEASQAVRAALPMLKRARAVHLVTFDDGTDFADDDFRHYLSLHGVDTRRAPHDLDGQSVGEALCLAAKTDDASYIVMGAYGHSRFREAVLGGVSRYMLANSPVPLLLAH